MEAIFTPEFFNTMLIIMAVVGLVVFISLYFVDAGYGKMISAKWGPAMPNKWGWMLMEYPVFFIVIYLWWTAAPEIQYKAQYLLFFLKYTRIARFTLLVLVMPRKLQWVNLRGLWQPR